MNEFDARVAKCSPDTQKILDFLRTAAAHAGRHVEPPVADAKGVGITYRTGGRGFCRFDPKHEADHVWAWVPEADRGSLSAAGTVSPREDGPWVTIRSMHGAVRLVSEIVQPYERVTNNK
jgi:hypothetical protein